jgi:glycosyltransferase involved in cell wall biosynthesis
VQKRICVVSSNYPTQRLPGKGAFVERLVDQWKKMGSKVDVIAPQSIPNILRSLRKKKTRKKFAGSDIVRPIYLSVSNKKIGIVDLQAISREELRKSVLRGVQKINIPDLFYGKFLMTGGYAALAAAKKYNRPVIADLGESRLIEQMDPKEINFAKEIVPQFDGFACVSQRLVDEVIELGAEPDTVLYAPNTVDMGRFHPIDKNECRRNLNLPLDKFIVAFVGHFIERKGPLRVLEAVNSFNNNVKGIFMGRGPQQPEGVKVLHAGSVPNEHLPMWLNAADVFVLPTLAEGYCNAINEAMACGLPIISSDIADIRPQVKKKSGILVDPQDPKAIAKAIRSFEENQDRINEFSQNALKLVEKRFKESRAERILNWITDSKNFIKG